MNYSDSKFNQAREWIKTARKNNISWEDIFVGNSKEGIGSFLTYHKNNDFWDVTLEDWTNLCKKQLENEQESVKCTIGPYIIPATSSIDTFTIPNSPSSMWMEYKDTLRKNGLKEDSIDVIEKTTHRILNRLKIKTIQGQPIKGMVIGNVQSGKTANMAALMSMAADRGWNFFIILSGTIENLRIQTQQRFLKDLHREKANINWTLLDNVKVGVNTQPSELYLSNGRNEKYFTVCLKNSTRLKNLLRWLNRDASKKQQMKVLLIDDEADQAGVNSSNIDKKEKTAINKAITNIIYDNDIQCNKAKVSFEAMNYIGYTATPYANVLNEGPGTEENPHTMFPEDFVAVLQSPNEYFGPQQIFGGEGFERLNIINHISIKETQQIKLIEKEECFSLPDELLNSIYWFYCCVACFRLWNIKKPVSMLVHTSQRVQAHENVSNLINNYLKNVNVGSFIKSCEKTWNEQTAKLNIESFFMEFKNYGGEDIYDYPAFKNLMPIIEELISNNIQYIKLDENKTFEYSKGVHLCVDNGKNNQKSGDNTFLRLAYPNKENNPDYATAFLVIGGATLSRGLTIEGLVSTYFLRTVKQADTLMQMGRWFGYRKHYELLPRIWMTNDTEDKFVFLSSLDLQLKKYMGDLDSTNQKPKYYGIKVMNSAKPSWMMVTSKNKMQKCIEVDMSYAGAKYQTTSFYSDNESLKSNLDSTKFFLEKINSGNKYNLCNENMVWRKVTYDVVFDYLMSLKLPDTSTFANLETMKEWFQKLTKDGRLTTWNIVVSSKKTTNTIELAGLNIGKVNRAKKLDNVDDGTINIGALRNPADLYGDIDLNTIDNKTSEKLKNASTDEINEIRNELGFSTISELIIYVIDKDSQAAKDSTTSTNMNLGEDIVGVAINIPGGKDDNAYAEALTIKPLSIPEEEGENI